MPINADTESRLFHEGLDLFNHGQWFEAHEVWEDIWHLASGEKKRFYQGLIQCAVTLEHMRRGNPRGVVTVFVTANEKFRGLPDVYMGINHVRLRQAIGVMVEAIRQMPAEVFEPRAGRGLTLPIDLDQTPIITLEYDPFSPARRSEP
ncbi:MAG: DUF309 domain-containing protein [Phycisphaeraceae bacterium]